MRDIRDGLVNGKAALLKPGIDDSSFERVLGVDDSGFATHDVTVLLPRELAHEIDDQRCKLTPLASSADDYTRAGVALTKGLMRMLMIAQANRNVINDESKVESAPADSASGVPSGAPDATQTLEPPELPDPQEPPTPPTPLQQGMLVDVVDMTQLNDRAARAMNKFNLTKAEKAAEAECFKALVKRGPSRLVGMPTDWRSALGTLAREMPNFAAVVELIEGCCALAEMHERPLSIPPMLLASVPGVGKTEFTLRLSEALGLPRFVYHLESAETASTLVGSDKHWFNSEFGELFRQIVMGDFANPVIVLDEVDKAPTGGTYKPLSALHAVLEPATARQLRDKSADVAFDASRVIYLATTNRLSAIDASLLSRFEIIQIERPDVRQALTIAQSIHDRVRDGLGLDPGSRPDRDVLRQLAMVSDPRSMQRLVKTAFARAARRGQQRIVVEDLWLGGTGLAAGCEANLSH